MIIKKLVLIRHGQSKWNELNKFTGWHDVELTKNGKNEAKSAALLLKKEKFFFDYSYTSVLKRAIHTLQYILDELDQSWLTVEKNWRLNERHYGALEGLNKNEVIEKYGEKKVLLWRRSFNITPPKINVHDKRFPGFDRRYSHLNINEIPLGESLEITAKRVIPYWEKNIYPKLKKNKKILIVAHGNSLRALIQYLNKINNQEILEINIPTATPIIVDFNENFIPIKWYYLK
ncbi:2,3-diphosphoglycerate-dependent phosphoglycerate mutase [Buchnera aphidicola]|uniref:2,3-bisphosphoglycerate-dependent phosphoglycerate mutase n=1 Tax=Buchnera aphidicola str. USDA (Myzus persicae) TaxID=1009856 RepID=W0P022_BUCMP|nr:2,3-diphosphoglycerate-dependent phosphoglycerate mutase [Buchnera aphidicola]AHG60079.1 Gpma [Buchnera aphidicola str. USDA (Myzus persicae)]AHG60659.1 Gpma [Buchnera aphidicola str. W106 (Myzus persicae)]AHG61231.1 Gpma [Buchnera aphidicola str. G002 (Myzus persicae)]AHG61804.1 Gpma [Buchnera aphidicola str. F009 (Myzus persicae)]WAI03234.1 MAG: 2,3-diphosphoglycerate-dependent phosphoglycerate mutase [Buchnera aphidicola (Myzus persicae)]